MQFSYIYHVDAGILCLILLLLMLLSLYAGRRFAKVNLKIDSGGVSSMTSSILALFAFILGFTYSMSNQRYDIRKELIIRESNELGTAILRADIFADSIRIPLREEFRQYLEARIAFYEAGTNVELIVSEMNKARKISKSIWDKVAYVNRTASNPATVAAMNSVNAMIDIESERFYKSTSRVPDSIVILLFLLCIASAFFTGCQSVKFKGLDWVMPVILQFMLTLVIYITLDLDRPRRGLINMDEVHQSMIELRGNFK